MHPVLKTLILKVTVAFFMFFCHSKYSCSNKGIERKIDKIKIFGLQKHNLINSKNINLL